MYNNNSCCTYNTSGVISPKDIDIQANFTSSGVAIDTVCGQLLQKIMCVKW